MQYFGVYTAYLILLIMLAGRAGHPGGVVYLSILVSISMLSLVVVFNPWRKDLFEPLKAAVGLYGLSFGLGPLLLGPSGNYEIWYYGVAASKDFFTTGAILCAQGVLALLAGYMAVSPRYWNPPEIVRTFAGQDSINRKMLWGGMGIGFVGFASYVVLVTRSGGIQHFLTYSDARSEIFSGVYGGFYWGTYFMISGLSLVGATIVRRHPFMTLLLGVVVGALFALLQGRADAIIPILVCVVLVNYGYKRIRFRTLVVASCALLLCASMMGAYRSADREVARDDIRSVTDEFFENAYEHFTETFATDIERLDIVLVAYRYVKQGGDLKKGETLLGWLSPVARQFFGATEDEFQTAGPLLFQVLNPQVRDVRAGAQPSLLGELYLNFALPGVLIGLFVYGILLKMVGKLVNKHALNDFDLALYPYVLVMAAMLVISGTHVVFRIVVAVAGVVIIGLFTQRARAGQKPKRRVRRSRLRTGC